jgi:hypothetical protein
MRTLQPGAMDPALLVDMGGLCPGLASLAFFAAAFMAPAGAPRSDPAGGRVELPVLAAQAVVQRPQYRVGVVAEPVRVALQP